MKPTRILLLCFLISFCSLKSFSQIPNNAWRDHLPYNHANRLVEFGDRIFCATSDGILFSFNINDNIIEKYSKVNGLSDAEISTIGYSELNNTFVIGYKNGNIDLVVDDNFINIPDIKRKMIIGDKCINTICFRGQYAYLACGFGIVVCDLIKHEIRDSYLFGPNGSQIFVNDIAISEDYIYAATTGGIYKADINYENLVDYTAWQHLENLPDPNAAYDFIAWFNNKLFTVYTNTLAGYDDIITVNDATWEIWINSYADNFTYLGSQNGYLVFSSLLKTKVYDNEEMMVRDVRTYYAKHALYDSRHGLWYADPESGLVKLDASGNGMVIYPKGPAYRDVGDIEILGGNMWVGAGTNASQWSGYGAYSFIDENWTNYNRNTIPELNDFLNISEISIDPIDNRHIIGGSFGYGIAEFKDSALIDIIDEEDGVLQPVTGFGHGYVQVTGTDFDVNGNLYIATSNSEPAIYRRKPGEDLEAIQVNYSGFGFNTNVGEILACTNGQVWLLLERDGVFIFKEEEEALQEKFLTVQNQVSDLLERVYSIAEDKEGNVWIGTNKGPVVYYSPTGIFEEGIVAGNQPEIPRNDGTQYVDLLLSTEKINDIEVDGADQKWFATEKSGVFLMSSDGKEEIFHFTEENSPLFSNYVQTVAIDDITGEVFFGTDKGIISFRGNATEGNDDFKNVYVFPNPVREDFNGNISITGLAKNVNVKITDITGNIVFETTALGGQAIWEGKNLRGERVQTGVYLVFCTNKEGSKTHVTKILFIH
jgi:hypothetical protein